MQSWSLAGGLIALCALADTFNGEFSGLFSRSENLKKFGNQFDSLADGLSFGLVPVVCLLQMSIFDSTAECVMWGAMAFFYIVCAITRLGDHSLHHEKRGGYVGIPTTVSGLIWSSAFLVKPSPIVSGVIFFVLGIAMVSPIRFPKPNAAIIVVLFSWVIILAGLHAANLILQMQYSAHLYPLSICFSEGHEIALKSILKKC